MECDAIIFVYFFGLRLGEYTGSKSDSTLFYLEDITLSCGRIVFAATAMEEDLQAATFMTLAFTTHKME